MWNRCFLVTCLWVTGCSEGQSKKTEQPVVEPVRPATIDASMVVQGDSKMVDEQWSAEVAKVDKIIYRFHDASVPPPDHRSYTITLLPSKIEKIVDSYGDIVSQQANDLEPVQFAAIQELLLGLSVAGADHVDESDGDKVEAACSGGTGDSLRLMAGDQEVYSELFSSCGSGAKSQIHLQVQAIGRAASGLLSGPASDGPTNHR